VSQRTAAALLAAMTLALSSVPVTLRAQQGQSAQNDEIARRAKTRVEPIYPELARKMHLSGTVKIEVVVAANGSVKGARIVGGHPVLAGAALDAARKWRFDPSPTESTGVIDFKFEPPE
jgi:TonB family protein